MFITRRLLLTAVFILNIINYICSQNTGFKLGFEWVPVSSTTSSTSPNYSNSYCNNINYTLSTSSITGFGLHHQGAPYNNESVQFPTVSAADGQTIQIYFTFNQPINNLRIRFIDLDENHDIYTPDPEEYIDNILPLPVSLTPIPTIPSFFFINNTLTPSDGDPSVDNNNTSAWVNWSGTISSLSFLYNRPGGGWGLILDSIYFECGQNESEDFIRDTSICAGDSVLLDANMPNGAYLWSNGSVNSSIVVHDQGIYWVRVTSNGSTYYDTAIVTVYNNPIAQFNITDTACINQSILIQNTTTCGSSYYWNFCSGNLSTVPGGINLGNLGSLNGPVYSSIAKDGNSYFVFITNHTDGTITRLSFGSNLTNTPVSTNLGNLGVLNPNIEGIQIKKDNISGKWFGFITGGQNNNYLARLDFGNSLNNTPVGVNLGNISNLLSYPHTIYMFEDGGNWYGFVGNYDISTLIRLNFGNSLSNIPTAINLGNVGSLDGPVGLHPIQDNGVWYLFVVNRNSNSLSRLNFGNSLTDTPNGVNLGNISGTLNNPRSITILKDCSQIFAFIVNENSNDIVRISFPNGLLSSPLGLSLGNIADFSFPHQISELFRVGNSLYSFIVNALNNTISRLNFPSCNNSSILFSDQQNPPVYSYNSTGTYIVSLVVNEGLPDQSNICKEVIVVAPITPVITGDTLICIGDSIKLFSEAPAGSTFQWTGPNGFISSSRNVIIPNANISNTGTYTLTVSYNGCSANPVSLTIGIEESPIVHLGNDTIICFDNNQVFRLDAGIGDSYFWLPDTSFGRYLNVSQYGTYSVIVIKNNGCSSAGHIQFINGCESTLFLPNAYSPNGDNNNDTYHASGFNIIEFKMLIFNRWGSLLFESNDINHGWDGTFHNEECPEGVYFCVVFYKNINRKMLTINSSVTLLR